MGKRTKKSPAFKLTKSDVIKTLRDLAIFSSPILLFGLEQYAKTGTVNTELLYAFAMSTVIAGIRRFLREVE